MASSFFWSRSCASCLARSADFDSCAATAAGAARTANRTARRTMTGPPWWADERPQSTANLLGRNGGVAKAGYPGLAGLTDSPDEERVLVVDGPVAAAEIAQPAQRAQGGFHAGD